MDPITIAIWEYSLVAGTVVVLIVAVLLILILVTARSIDRNAAGIWTVGKQIAANTVSIWMLQKTNTVAAEILGVAQGIAGGAKSIEGKVDGLSRALGGK